MGVKSDSEVNETRLKTNFSVFSLAEIGLRRDKA
jgi:hypothetical protein